MTFANPNSNAALTILEFNQASASSFDFEALNINFPLSADGLSIGPTLLDGSAAFGGIAIGGAASANALPFGPVRLAFPDISQIVDAGVNYQRTYFFTDTFG